MTNDEKVDAAPADDPFDRDLSGDEYNFVYQMKIRREALGISQTEFARRLTDHSDNLSTTFYQATIQRIETGERPVKLFEALWIARVLGTTIADMLGGYSPQMAYGELADHVAADTFERQLHSAEDAVWRAKHSQEMIRELIEQYRRSVAATPGSTLNDDLVMAAERVSELYDPLIAPAEALASAVRRATEECARIPRDYPRSIDDRGSAP